jgi:hypothetical protein
MSRRNRRALPLLSALACAALLSAAAALPAKGKAAPAWSGKTTAGKSISSSQLKGKVVLLNFFNNY